MMVALIENGRVTQVAAAEFPVHETLTWVPCGSEVQQGWLWDGTAFSAPPPEVLS